MQIKYKTFLYLVIGNTLNESINVVETSIQPSLSTAIPNY